MIVSVTICRIFLVELPSAVRPSVIHCGLAAARNYLGVLLWHRLPPSLNAVLVGVSDAAWNHSLLLGFSSHSWRPYWPEEALLISGDSDYAYERAKDRISLLDIDGGYGWRRFVRAFKELELDEAESPGPPILPSFGDVAKPLWATFKPYHEKLARGRLELCANTLFSRWLSGGIRSSRQRNRNQDREHRPSVIKGKFREYTPHLPGRTSGISRRAA